MDDSISVNATVTEFTLRGLLEFLGYDITVIAVNSGGINTSEVLTVRTIPAGK